MLNPWANSFSLSYFMCKLDKFSAHQGSREEESEEWWTVQHFRFLPCLYNCLGGPSLESCFNLEAALSSTAAISQNSCQITNSFYTYKHNQQKWTLNIYSSQYYYYYSNCNFTSKDSHAVFGWWSNILSYKNCIMYHTVQKDKIPKIPQTGIPAT